MADELKENLEQETKPSKKRSKLFWALLASGIGAVIIAVVLLVVFLMPKEEKFDINLGSSGTTSSVVLTGDGSYTKGDSVTIVAQDIEGYRFVNWTYNGNIVSEEREYTFVIGVSTQGEYTANYARVYKIKVSENQYGTFTINPTSAIAGEEITVEFEIGAEYQDEYTFSDLYYMYNGNTTENIIENNRFIMPEGDVTIYARLDNLYNINLTSNISDSVEVDLIGEGLYAENASATITAPYVEGYRFRSWTYRGEVVSNSPTYIIENVNENTSGTYIANYDSPFSVTINMPSGTLNKTAFVNDEMSFNCVLEDIITDKEIIKQKIQILAEGEELSYTEENGQFSFIMPASNVEINIIEDSKLSRITDFMIKNNRVVSYTGTAKEVTVPSSYYPYQQETGNILRFKTQQEYLNTIMNDYGFMYLFGGGHFSYKTNNSAEVVYVETAEDGVLWFENTMSYTEDHFPLEITLPTEYTVTLEDIKGITEAEMAIFSPIAVILMSNNCLLSFTYQIGDAEPINVDINNSEDLFTILENTLGDNFDPKEVLPIKYSNFKYGKTIPCVGDGVKIERLGDLDVDNGEIVFSGNTNITKVIVPEGITSIGEDVFSGCTSLTEVSLPTTLTSIDGKAFTNCTSLSSIIIPEGVKSIGYNAFYGCTNLQSVNFGDNPQLQAMGNYVFSNCTSLTFITIPSNLTEIGSFAFEGCTNLQSVDFGENSKLQTIGGAAFSGCTRLSSIAIPDTVIEVGQDAFSNTALTFTADNNGRYLASATNQYCILIYVDDPNVTEFAANDKCKIISTSFSNCYNLIKVTIPSSVIYISSKPSCDIYYQGTLGQWLDIVIGGASTSNNLYINDQLVTEITINNNIKDYAFYGITSLKKVTLGENVTSIGNNAFYACENLDVYYQGTLDQWLDINFKSSIWSVGGINLYINNQFVEEITINKDIKDHSFYGITSLKKVTLGENVTSIGNNAFNGSYNLNIYYQGTLDQWLDITLGSPEWQNCNLYINDQIIEEITINKNIKDYAFMGITSPTRVTLGENVTSIGDYAFYGCTNLKSIEFGKNSQLKTIGYGAFYNCTNLTTITIPSSVAEIEYTAFSNCYSLAIVINNSEHFTVSKGGSDNGYVGLYAYEVVKAGEAQGSIEELNNVRYYINDTTQEKVALSIIDRSVSSVSLIEDTTVINQYAFSYCTNLTSITIPSSVISIGNNAFLGTNLQTITFEDGSQLQSIDGFIPASIEHIIFEGNSSLISISDWTFSSSVNLQTIDFGENSQLQTIGNSAFSSCYRLQTIDFGANSQLQTIGEYAFQDCSSITSISIPSNVTSIGNNAFLGTNLQTITFEDGSQLQSIDGFIPASIEHIIFEGNSSLISISDWTFSSSVNLQTIDFGANSQLQTIGEYAFGYCTNLTSITIPEGVTSIGSHAFYNCDSLQIVEFGDNSHLQTIGDQAFDGCTNLQTVDFGTNSQLHTIGNYAFQNCSSITSISIPSSVTSIGGAAFQYCSNLQTVDFGDNSQLQTIGEFAFQDCSSITSISIPSSVTSIGNYAFEYCTNLTSINIPANVTEIGSGAFQNCSNLTTVTIESDDVYNAAVGVESNHAGGLLANAETVYVLKTIVDNEVNSNEYLTSNFTRSESGDGLYYIYTKSNTTT